jgi:hypothetical protein
MAKMIKELNLSRFFLLKKNYYFAVPESSSVTALPGLDGKKIIFI